MGWDFHVAVPQPNHPKNCPQKQFCNLETGEALRNTNSTTQIAGDARCNRLKKKNMFQTLYPVINFGKKSWLDSSTYHLVGGFLQTFGGP